MAINPLLLNVKPISEITTVDNPIEGHLLFYDGSDELKKVDIVKFQSLIGGIAKPLAIADATPTTAGWYKPTTSGTYANAGGLVAQVGYDTLFYFDGTTWSLTAVDMPMQDLIKLQESSNEFDNNKFAYSIPIKGIFSSSAEANLQEGESYFNSNLKVLVELKNGTIKESLLKNGQTIVDVNGLEYIYNGVDLELKLAKNLVSSSYKTLNSNILVDNYRRTTVKIKKVANTVTEEELLVNEAYFNLNTKQIVVKVTSNWEDRLIYTPIIGQRILYNNRYYIFNGNSFVLSPEDVNRRIIKNEFVKQGSFVNKTDGNFSSNINLSNTGFIPIINESKIIIKSLVSGGNGAGVAFYGVNGFISSFSENQVESLSFFAKEIEIPNGSLYYIANSNISENANDFVVSNFFYKKENEVIDLVDVNYLGLGFWDKNGVVNNTNNTYKYSDYLDYINGDIFIKSFSGVNASLICFFDSNNKYISSISGSVYNNQDIRITEEQIPKNTRFFTINTPVSGNSVIKVSKLSWLELYKKHIETRSFNPYGLIQDGNTELLISTSFVNKSSDAIYSDYDALMIANPDYITKINLESYISESKPSVLADKNFFMYKFKPKYVPNNNNQIGTNDGQELKVMIVSGTHDEPYGIRATYDVMKFITNQYNNSKLAKDMRLNVTFYVIPVGNPWALDQPNSGEGGNIRVNANGVDLNRNMDTLDWKIGTNPRTNSGTAPNSEYESKLLKYQIDTIKPDVFIDFHNHGIDEFGNLGYIITRKEPHYTIATSAVSELNSIAKKIDSKISQNINTNLFWLTRIAPNGCRSTYAEEQGINSYTFEVSNGHRWNNGELTSILQRHADSVVCTYNAQIFIYFLNRVLTSV